MARGFNLTAELNLRGPSNIRTVVADIRRQLGTISANVNLRIDPATTRTVGNLNASLTQLNRTLRITAGSATSVADAMRDMMNAMRGVASVRMPNHAAQISSSLQGIQSSASSAQRAISSSRSEIEEFGNQAGLAVRRFAAFSTVTSVIYGLTGAIKSGVSDFIDFDKQITRISQVTGESKEDLGRLKGTITSLSTGLGVTAKDLANVSVTLSQAGLGARDTETALRSLALSALTPSFDDMNQTVEGSIALMRQFKISAVDLESALGSINAVSAKFAVESSDIIAAIQRTGGVFAAASKGVSEGKDALNEFIAVFTSIRATTRESAETIATGLRTIFTRIQRGDTIEALKEFGVNLTDVEGKFVGAYRAVQLLSEGLGRIDPRDLKFSRIVEELGGFRQIGKVIPLIQEFATAQQALQIAQAGQGSLASDAAKGQLALAVQISKTREEFLSLIRSIGDTNSFQLMVKVGLDLASALIKVADAAKGVIPLVGLFAAFKGASAINQFASGFGKGFGGVNRQNAPLGFASGGLVPGRGNSDTVPARLTPGEFVIRKKAVQSIGVNKLHTLNRNNGGIIPSYSVNRYASDTQRFANAGKVQKNRSSKDKKEQKPLVPEAATEFTHLDARVEPANFSPRLKKYLELNGINVSGLYSNMGLELPRNWNRNWNLDPDYKGVFKQDLANYISSHEVFDSLINSTKKYRFTGRSNAPATQILKDKNNKIRTKLAAKIRSAPVKFYDTDRFEVSTTLPNLLKNSIKEVMSGTESDALIKGFEEKSVYKQGSKRKAIYEPMRQNLNGGGSVRKFADAGVVSPTAGKKASTSEIIKVLGLETAAKAGGISSTDVYTILNKRAPTQEQAASKAAILAEFTKKQNRLLGAKQARTTRITSKGLLFGAAGMLGSPFAPINKTIESNLLKSPVDVRIISGLMKPDLASSIEQSFSTSINKTANKAAKKAMVSDILDKVGLGRELNLDFDRTLAFGADKVLADPKTPKFSEFGDRTKVAAALKGAKLSLLGRELASMVSSKPELISNLRLITARPASTLDLIQGWLSSQGLPIPLTQFKGLGGQGVSGSQIAKLKAELLSPGSVFVDDDARNIKAAKARSKEGITSYRYGNRKSITNANADATAQGVIFEKMIEKLGGPAALKGSGLDFPMGLKGAAKYFGLPANIPTDAKRTISGPSTVEDNIITYLKNVKGYNLGGIIQKFAKGGSAQDTVPALLTPGEFVINKKAASRIGSSKLNQLNRADKVKGFNTGGPVGSIQEFATGGAVQRLFFGGAPRLPARPDNANMGNVQISSLVGTQIQDIITALNDLGISSSRTADLIKRGGQISYQAATRAYEADIQRMRIAGASAVQIAEAEQRLRSIREDAARNIGTRRLMSGTNGGQLQEIDERANLEKQRITNQLRDRMMRRGMTSDEADSRLASNAGRINNMAYQTATQSVTGVDLRANGLNGSDMQRYIQQSMMDKNTLQQMNRQYLDSRRRDLEAVGHSAKEARRIAQQEVREREKIVSDIAKSRGMNDPTSRGASQQRNQQMMMASFMIPMIGSAVASAINSESSRGNAALSAGVQGFANTAAMGGAVYSMLPEAISESLGPFALVAVAAAAVGQAMIDARNATIEFDKKLAQNKTEKALEVVARSFEDLSKDIKNTNIKQIITTKLVEASNQIKFGVEADVRQAKAYWTNLLDAYFAGGTFGTNQKEITKSAERSQILDKKGMAAYFASTGFGQAMMGNFSMPGGAADKRADIVRSGYMQELAPERAQQNAKLYADTANQINNLIEQRLKGGENLDSILAAPEFKQFSEVLAKANATVGAQILSIQSNILLSDEEKKAKIESIQATYAEGEARKRASIVGREKEVKAIEQSTTLFSRSLERMYQNMDQAINKTVFGLEKMSQELDLMASSLKGEATIGQGSLKSINILQNPNVYSSQEKESARSQASGLFTGNRNLVKGLLSLGDNLETSIMTTLNKTLRADPNASNEKIGLAIEKNIREELSKLALPTDVGDKLANEVKNALDQLRKQGDDKVDFSQLVEKIPQLSKVIDSTKRAQEIALKALENWQNALNNYSTRMNQLADLQLDTNMRLRKSTQILADSQLDLAKTLGQTIEISDVRRNAEFKTGQLTGGLINPQDISQNILKLEGTRQAQESGSDVARQRGGAGIDDFMRMQNNLRNTNVALRENYEALKNLAENTETASAALNKMQEAQQKNQGRVGFIEKLVTSTPEELDSLSMAFGRLQNNMNGQINTIQNSRGAQKAYYEALQNGASGFEALRAAQTAFANERKETLGALNDLLPFLGNNQQSNDIRANVLESMLKESGIGASPLMQQVLTTLRNPQADPETQAAMQQYQQAINAQSEANRQLAMLNTKLGAEIADKSAQALKDALTSTSLNFQNAELTDIKNDVRAINLKMGDRPVPAVGKASGGVIYAAAGMNIDFAPKGTDTVPAMLTPGEFVVNRAATQRHLPLLQSINSQKYNKGGSVKYYATGGYVSDIMKPELKADRKGDSLNETDEPYMDPSSPPFQALVKDKAPGVFTGWKNFTRKQDNTENIYSPSRWGGSVTNGSIEFKRSSSNPILAGAAPNIDLARYIDGGKYFLYNATQPTKVDPINEVQFLGHLLSKSSIPSRRIKQSDIEQYKKDIFKIQFNLGGNKVWGTKANDLNISSINAIETNAGQSGTNYNPNISSTNPVGVLLSDNGENRPVLNPFFADQDSDSIYKVWQEMTSLGWRGTLVSTNAAGTGASQTLDTTETVAGPNGSRAGQDVRDKGGTINPLMTPRTSFLPTSEMAALGGSWINKEDQLKSTINTQVENIKLFKKTVKASVNGFNFKKTTENTNLLELQQKLQKLYKGYSVVEDLTKNTDLLDLDALGANEEIKTLYLLSDSKNSSLIQRMKELEPTPDIREKQGWNDLNVGTIGPSLGQDWMNGIPVGIADNTDIFKQFPWVGNLNPEVLLAELKADIQQKQIDLSKGTDYGFDVSQVTNQVNEKLPAPLDKYSLRHTEQYLKYSGPLWNPDDPNSDDMGFLPAVKDYYIAQAQANKEDIFQAVAAKTERQFFKSGNFFQLADLIPRLNAANLQTLQNYLASPSDPKLQADIKKVSLPLSPSLLKSKTDGRPSGLEGFDLFSKEDNTPIDLNLGDYLLNAGDQLVAAQKNKALGVVSQIEDPNSISIGIGNSKSAIWNFATKQKAAVDLSRGALNVFGRSKIPGFANGWLSRYIGRAPAILNNAKNENVLKSGLMYISSVFNDAGAYASNLFGMARNPQQYDALKNAYVGITGAWKAFSGLASGDTRFLKTLQDQGDYLALFRSLGASVGFQKAANRELAPDYQARLGLELKGSRIRRIGADGSLSYEPFTAATPKTYQDLVDAALNPYNEFTQTNIRQNLIDTLINDISNGRDALGMPFFDSTTLDYINSNLRTLQKWYGGDGAWPGQDYFYDETLNEKNRTDAVINALQNNAAGSLLDEANLANVKLGVAARFGSLPTAKWFEARQMATPDYKATGGMIYASKGQMVNFQPRGTDTVPAMLTPGEFVVNRSATQQHLPLLKAINSGSSQVATKKYSQGGVVYLASGGQASAGNEPTKTKPVFDLNTTTVNRPENSFGNRSVNTLSQVQYESRYGIPGIRNNIKMIPDDFYAELSERSKQSAKLQKEAQGFFSVDKAKFKRGAKLKLDKTEYTKLSIGETERLIPYGTRETQQYYPDGADFDHNVFDKKMLEYKDLPIINYLNADIRTSDQRNQAIRQAAGDKENGFPDLMAKYLLGLQEYESTWASTGLSFLIDAPNLLMPDANDFGASVLPKALKALSKTTMAQGIKEAIKKGKGKLDSLYTAAFRRTSKGSISIPSKDLGLDAMPVPASSKRDMPSSSKADPITPSTPKVNIDPALITKNLSEFNTSSGPGTLKQFSGKFFEKVDGDSVYRQITDFIKLLGLDNDPSLGIPKSVEWPKSAGKGVGGYFQEVLQATFDKVGGRPKTGTKAGAGSVVLAEQHAYRGVLFHELTHQLINIIRKTKPAGSEAWSGYQSKILDLFDSGSPNNFIRGFDALGGGYNSADVLYATRYKLRALEEIQNKGTELPVDVKSIYSRLKGGKYNLGSVSEADNSAMTNYIAGIYGNKYIQTISSHGHEEFLTTMIERAGSLGLRELNIVDSVLNDMLSSIGVKRSNNLVDLSGLSGDMAIPKKKARGNFRGLSETAQDIATQGSPKEAKAGKTLTEKFRKLIDWQLGFRLGGTPDGPGIKNKKTPRISQEDLIKETDKEVDRIIKETIQEVEGEEALNKQIRHIAKDMIDSKGNIKTNRLPINIGMLAARTIPAIVRNQQANTSIVPPQGERIPEPVDLLEYQQPDPTQQTNTTQPSTEIDIRPPAIPIKSIELENSGIKQKYWDELTYKEYLMSLIRSKNAPIAPDKSLFTTSAIYTKGKRTTALDTRDTSGVVGGNPVKPPANAKDKAALEAQIKDIGNELYASSNSAYDSYSKIVISKNKKEPLDDIHTGNLIDNYRKSIENINKLIGITNVDKFGTLNLDLDKPLPGESSSIKLGSIIDTLKAVRIAYKNDILPGIDNNQDAEPRDGETPEQAAQRSQRAIEIDDSILDLFGRQYAPITQTRPDAVPGNGKKFTGREVSDTARENDQFPMRTRITGAKGIESQYKSAYAYYRKILGEYNYHKSIGKLDRYAQGNKTTATVARTLATGGMVYASTGMLIPYEPKGTDTVPAMLTPGEFVVNAKATAQHLPLLRSINNNTYLAKGGSVGKTSINIPADTFKQNLDTVNNNIIKNHNISTAIQNQNKVLMDRTTQTQIEAMSLSDSVEGIKDQVGSLYIKTDNATSILNRVYDKVFSDTNLDPVNKSRGGIIYAANGQLVNFAPRGTDTVPAMLTPGEFVVNAKATQQNLGLLKAINSGTKGYSDGGVVYPIYRIDGGSSKPTLEDRRAAYQQRREDEKTAFANRAKQRKEKKTPYDEMLTQRGVDSRAAREEQAQQNQQARGGIFNQLYNEVAKQYARDPSKFDIKSYATLTPQQFAENYETNFATKPPADLYTYAKAQYDADKRKYEYLKTIYTNSNNALMILSRQPGVGNRIVGDSGRSLRDILQTVVKGSYKEGLAIDEGWKILGQNHPEFLAQNSPSNQRRQNAAGFANGGLIYANGGMLIPYQPRGTDTVPAMLTPGEFVVNRDATKQNLPLLRSINSNRYNRGGRVKYLANGSMTDESGAGGGVSSGSGGSSTPNMDGLSQFTTKFAEFIGQLQSINLPPVINVMGNHKVEVVINGASVFQELEPRIGQLVVSEVGRAMDKLNSETEGALGRK